MMPRLEIALSELPFERNPADLFVVGFFVDELPLLGAAGQVDWRLCGLVSDQLVAGRMKGEWGEALLVPSCGRLAAPRVLVLGLGRRDDYKLPQIDAGNRAALVRGLQLGARQIVLPPLGLESDDFPRAAEVSLRGALEGMGTSRTPMRVTLLLPKTEILAASQAIEDAAKVLDRSELSFSRHNIRRSSPPASPFGRAVPARSPGRP